MQGDDRVPDLFVRGRAIYPANLNATNPVGTVQSIEHTLRNFDKVAADQQNRVTRVEKELADYRPQADRPFEHEERLKQLLTRQAELNSVLDLDKGYEGAVLVAEESEIERADPSPLENHETVARMAAAYMRKSGTAMREMNICERTAPTAGQVAAKVVAKDEAHVALASAANNFFIVPSSSLCREAHIGERLSLRFDGGASPSTIGVIGGVRALACTGFSQQTLYKA